MRTTVKIGSHLVGDGHPVFIIAEIGINHNGDLELAKRLIQVAHQSGCNAVKFQKRTPDKCVPESEKKKLRETPWGTMTYLEYRYRVEFSEKEYQEIDQFCNHLGILWFASCWDEDSAEFLIDFNIPCLKIPSAKLTDHKLLLKVKNMHVPLILSTGMSSQEEVDQALEVLGRPGQENLILCHCTSTYPCSPQELNLNVLTSYRRKYPFPIGYSGHEVGLQTTVAAAALGARVIERHITMDRAIWGTDQAASVEPEGLRRLVRDIRVVEKAMGDGLKKFYPSEIPVREKLRGTSLYHG